jgi:hypothetical protein
MIINLTEQTTSHLPALQLLCKMGYQYLTPQEAGNLTPSRLFRSHPSHTPLRCAAGVPLRSTHLRLRFGYSAALQGKGWGWGLTTRLK